MTFLLSTLNKEEKESECRDEQDMESIIIEGIPDFDIEKCA
jgi:hypothetical protein